MRGAADLEGADFLQVLAFEEEVYLGAVLGGCERGEGFRGEHGGSVDAGFDELEGFDDGGAGEWDGGGRHLWILVLVGRFVFLQYLTAPPPLSLPLHS